MLLRTAEEDLTFRVTYEKETKETVIAGMAELHIAMILDKIREHQKIEMETTVPRVAYRETIQGRASELVWGFADRVARQIHESHPGKRITCGAYTSYVEPPDSIKQFSPNLAVWISNCGRPKMTDPEHWADYLARIKHWRDKLAPGNILRLENNRYHIWGDGEPISYPVLHPRGVARDLKALQGISLGDTGEQSQVGG